jgi:hypothetical protein
MGGHLPSAARSNTYPVLFRNYLRGDPTTLEWAQDIVGQALVDAERSALDAHRRALNTHGGRLRVITGPADAEHLQQAGLDADTARRAADGLLDTAWSGCTDHDHHPATGTRCHTSFLDCFHCGNCLITHEHLPRQLGLLDALAARRHQLSEQDWWGRYGAVWAAIRRDVLVKFSPAEIEQAQAIKPDDTCCGHALEQGGPAPRRQGILRFAILGVSRFRLSPARGDDYRSVSMWWSFSGPALRARDDRVIASASHFMYGPAPRGDGVLSIPSTWRSLGSAQRVRGRPLPTWDFSQKCCVLASLF